jgi:hypothetical protein
MTRRRHQRVGVGTESCGQCGKAETFTVEADPPSLARAATESARTIVIGDDAAKLENALLAD